MNHRRRKRSESSPPLGSRLFFLQHDTTHVRYTYTTPPLPARACRVPHFLVTRRVQGVRLHCLLYYNLPNNPKWMFVRWLHHGNALFTADIAHPIMFSYDVSNVARSVKNTGRRN